MSNRSLNILLVSIILFSISCNKKDFLDVNKTPNNPTDVPAKVLLPSTTYGIAFTNGNELGRVAGELIQHNAGTANQAIGFDVYNLDGSFDNGWDFEIYSNAVSDLRTLISKTE